MIIGICIPRPFDLEWAGGLAVIRITQVRRDAVVLSFELLDWVKGIAAMQAGDRRIQSPAGDEQQREARTGLLIMDTNGAFFIEGHGSSSLLSLLSKQARRGGHSRRCDACCKYVASGRFHDRRPP